MPPGAEAAQPGDLAVDSAAAAAPAAASAAAEHGAGAVSPPEQQLDTPNGGSGSGQHTNSANGGSLEPQPQSSQQPGDGSTQPASKSAQDHQRPPRRKRGKRSSGQRGGNSAASSGSNQRGGGGGRGSAFRRRKANNILDELDDFSVSGQSSARRDRRGMDGMDDFPYSTDWTGERDHDHEVEGNPAGGRNNRSSRSLLRFDYSPPTYASSSARRGGRGGGRGGRPTGAARFGGYKRMPRFSKEKYVQASYRFVLEPGDYDKSFADADETVDWSKIQLVYSTSDNQEYTCPICLEPPVAAKMTKCGHVFCYSCILHEFQAVRKRQTPHEHKCPLCHETIYKLDLKSALVQTVAPPAVGEYRRFVLVTRSRTSVNCSQVDYSPHSHAEPSQLPRSSLGSDSEAGTGTSSPLAPDGATAVGDGAAAQSSSWNDRHRFAKIMVTDSIHWIVERERSELLRQLQEASKSPLEVVYTTKYIHDALNDLTTRERAWNKKYGPPPALHSHNPISAPSAAGSSSSHRPAGVGVTRSQLAAGVPASPMMPTHFGGNFGGSFGGNFGPSPTMRVSPSSSANSTPTDSPSGEDFYFFQAADGQNVFLNSLNYRCLVEEFGEPTNFPRMITAKVLEIDFLNQNHDTQRKLRFLSHLPLSAEFMLCEVDLAAPHNRDSLLSPATLAKFAGEIAQRRKARQRAAARQRREEAAHARRVAEEYDRRTFTYDESAFPEFEYTNDAPLDIETPPLVANSATAGDPSASGDFTLPPPAASVADGNWSTRVARGYGAVDGSFWAPLPSSASSSKGAGAQSEEMKSKSPRGDAPPAAPTGGPAPVTAPAAVWPVRRSPHQAAAFPQAYLHKSKAAGTGGSFSSPPLQRNTPSASAALSFPSPAESRKSAASASAPSNSASRKNAAGGGGGKKGKKSKKSKKAMLLFSNAGGRRS